MNTIESSKISGFCLIEVLISIAIFSLFLTIIWQTEQFAFRYLSEVLKKNSLGSEVNQLAEALIAYPNWDLSFEKALSESVTLYEDDFYREMILCENHSQKPCLSILMANPSEVFL